MFFCFFHTNWQLLRCRHRRLRSLLQKWETHVAHSTQIKTEHWFWTWQCSLNNNFNFNNNFKVIFFSGKAILSFCTFLQALWMFFWFFKIFFYIKMLLISHLKKRISLGFLERCWIKVLLFLKKPWTLSGPKSMFWFRLLSSFQLMWKKMEKYQYQKYSAFARWSELKLWVEGVIRPEKTDAEVDTFILDR